MVTIVKAERRARYNPVVATTTFAVLDADGDPAPVFDLADVSVYRDGDLVTAGYVVNGTFNDGFSIDAVVVFAVGVTGVIDIVCDRGPHRTDQFADGRGVPAADQNLSLNRLSAETRELYDSLQRTYKSRIGSKGGTILPGEPGQVIVYRSADTLEGRDISTFNPDLINPSVFMRRVVNGVANFNDWMAESRSYATRAVVAASVITGLVAGDYITVRGHTTEWEGSANYKVLPAAPPTVYPEHLQSANGVWFVIAAPILHSSMFGTKGDNNGQSGVGTDNSVPMRNFHDACVRLGREGYIEGGRYRFASQLLWDQGIKGSTIVAIGSKIFGAGEGNTIFKFDNEVPSPCFQISNKTGWTAGDGQRPVFFGGFGHLTIETSTSNGIGFLFGDGNELPNGNTSVYNNGFALGPVVVANRAQSVNSIAALLSGLITTYASLVTANCGGVPASHGGNAADFYGTAIKAQHCAMSAGSVLAVGNAKVGLHFAGGGSMHGNVISSVDFEVLETCVKSDNPNTRVMIMGGTMTLCSWMFDCTAAQSVVVKNILLGDVEKSIFKNPTGGAGVYGGWGVRLEVDNVNLVGVQRLGSYFNTSPNVGPGPTVPTQPAAYPTNNNVWIKNGGQRAQISIFGASNPSVTVDIRDWFDFSSGGNRVAVGPFATVVYTLEAGESMRVNSPNAWNWLWRPLP
jgi:hypothetical protein